MKDSTARGRVDQADEIAPLVAVLDRSQRTLPLDRPNLVQDGLEAIAVFIHCPQLDDAVRKRGCDFAQERA
jgi:hypothetical protein